MLNASGGIVDLIPIENNSQVSYGNESPQKPIDKAGDQNLFCGSQPGSIGEAIDSFVQLEQLGLANENLPRHSPSPRERIIRSASQQTFCALSDQTAREYARLTMTKNLIRIYHDSMENALSCWLTERNCPYSQITKDGKSRTEQSEWGPTFSNRVCRRVCRLDYTAASIRGRSLSIAEDKAASRALHKSIMAFASQWAQNFEIETAWLSSNPLIADERSSRECLWNDARHTLETSVGIPSFRVVFANILFSLTQRPMNEEDELGLDDLIEKDDAYPFLENAVRQMFSFRYKLAQARPGGVHQNMKFSESNLGTPQMPSNNIDTAVFDAESRDTFDLLFWLGVMFDTQIAAMHQRPPVVSDEDSQKASGSIWRLSTATSESSFDLDLDGFTISSTPQRRKNRDLWGDFLLQKPTEYHRLNTIIPTSPYSQEQAAEILSDAAPVKILLWRRITQLQTLIYRDAEPETIEEGIQKALLVYRHWNSTYDNFIFNCISNHPVLPPRVQSWYVVLAAHWHLGAILLADVIDNIDQAQLGLKPQQVSRNAMQFTWTLKRDNASAVATLARCSLYEEVSRKSHQFHDSLGDAAFLTEPFTVLLIQSFAKSGYIFLDNLDMSQSPINCGSNGSFDQSRQGCEICIRALQCLGRKSDMASLVARGLSRRLNLKLHPEFADQSIQVSEYLAGIDDYSWESDTTFDFAKFPIMNNDTWM